MSWSIALIKNTLKVPAAAKKELFQVSQESYDEIWWKEEEVTDKEGHLAFNYDHSEHMDFLWKDDYLKILKAHKAKGVVRFGSLEGDNSGSFWGYRFDGQGNMRKLKGRVIWNKEKDDVAV